ncbi:hypothetical protein FA95DRAFT_1561072 [Auriscalpium vulgare]|uniref:Uncharacterized protein n=1 Tax=Auriscalpium vulgare TaxID=40419 RepID=A0ACB8RPF5_9AGAM|nr:hypothetical protein FA95DRAFT_1561072 [Auriscalpium vulgare]
MAGYESTTIHTAAHRVSTLVSLVHPDSSKNHLPIALLALLLVTTIAARGRGVSGHTARVVSIDMN